RERHLGEEHLLPPLPAPSHAGGRGSRPSLRLALIRLAQTRLRAPLPAESGRAPVNALMPMSFPGERACSDAALPAPATLPSTDSEQSAPRQRPRLRSALGSSCWRPSARAAVGSCLAVSGARECRERHALGGGSL